jgi:replicative DNA helicase
MSRATAMERLSTLERIPPQNIEAEQSTLGSMLIERTAVEKAAEILKDVDFYRPSHGIIFDSICSLAERDEPVDLITLQEELRTRGRLEEVGGTEYLMALLSQVPSASRIEYYAKIVEEKSILRKLLSASSEINGLVYSEPDDVEGITDKAEQLIFQVSQRRLGQYFTPISPVVMEAWERLASQWEEGKIISGLDTGFRDLDLMTSGLQNGDLVFVAARPSMGKTSLALDIASHVALKKKLPVALFSVEMSKEQLALRMLSSHARVESQRLRAGKLDEEEISNVAEATNRLYQAPIFIDDSTDITPMVMRAKCRRLKAEHGGLALVVVDYLQLLKWHRNIENRVQEISEIARALKSLARELKVPVMALSQLSRRVEQRDDKRPILSDLRESGSIEAEADLVVMLFRPKYYERKERIDPEDAVGIDSETGKPKKREAGVENSEEAEIIIAKQRNGPTGTILLSFLSHYAHFVDTERYRTY